MSDFFHVINALSKALLAGAITIDDMQARCIKILGQHYPWLQDLCKKVLEYGMEQPTRLNRDHLTKFIEQDEVFNKAWRNQKHRPRIRYFSASIEKMQEPPLALMTAGIPPLATIDDLSKWLMLSQSQLEWYASCWKSGIRTSIGPLHHYTYKWVPTSGDSPRLIEAPKSRLREFQRKVLQEILMKIPPHPSAHGFVKGRSCVTFCSPHTNHHLVLRMDLKRFFPSIRYGRITGLFRTIGYPRGAALRLAGLCTNKVPHDILSNIAGLPVTELLPWNERKMYRHPHLPQGAPTSPAIANMCAYRLDCRLKGAAKKSGAVYTRYADDLAFSGGPRFGKNIRRFHILACAIALEEGFEVNTRKTRIMRQGVRQKLTGIIVNRHANINRKDYDRLKATLYNCVRHGPGEQNKSRIPDFRTHLAGKIAYVNMINPNRSQRLKKLFNKIQWD